MVTLRPARSEDREFLFSVYASTRTEELAPVPWTQEQKAAFLRMQFDAQDVHYRAHYESATYEVIEVDGVAAGRLTLHRRLKEIRLVDIALLPNFRGTGIGTRLLAELIAEAKERGVALTIHVEMSNPARRLYERLGFAAVEEHGVYLLMARWPEAVEVRVS